MINYFNKILPIPHLIFLSFSLPAMATEGSIGLGVSWLSSPYKEHNATSLPVPLLYYNNESFYVQGLDTGLYLWKDKQQQVSLGVTYATLAFDSGKTGDNRLKKLDDRHASMSAYLQYNLKTDYGQTRVRVLRDILSNSEAFSAEAYHTHPFILGSVYVSPGIGLHWGSRKQLDYYFGVSPKEAQKTGLNAYAPNSGIFPFLSLETNWRATKNWSLLAAGRVMFLNKRITDSPMVNDKKIYSATVGLQYQF